VKEKEGEHPYGDAGQLILLLAFLIVWAGDSFVLRVSTFLSEEVPLYIRLVLLGIAMLCAVYLARAGHAVVSHHGRPERMVSTGAFRYVRHPLYLGSILFYLGLIVSTASLFSFALLVGIFLFYNRLASYEEEWLFEEYGEDYRAYKKRTGKWVPKIGR
jgi:protein-S-isoprenylcysteine O-methyltransferase Ste14